MNTTKEWLNAYLDISDKDILEIADAFTKTGTKVEKIEQNGIKGILFGKIVDIYKHENSDNLQITKIDIGRKRLQIITAAKNVKISQIVPVATDNSILADGKVIRSGNLRGEISEGMLCSYQEIGIAKNHFENTDEHGILIFPSEYEKYLGREVSEVLNLNKEIIEFEITPNRPDCLGMMSLAKELAIALNKKTNLKKYTSTFLKDFNIEKEYDIQKCKDIVVDVNTDKCNKFILLKVQDIDNTIETPEYISKRLLDISQKPINPIVDILNYTMFETAQPFHAYDLDKIIKLNNSNDIRLAVCNNKNDKKVVTLDNEEIEIKNDIVVELESNNICLSLVGIIGLDNVAVDRNTKNILIEIANFERKPLRDTSRRLNLRSESYSRFEKRIAKNNVYLGLDRLIYNLKSTFKNIKISNVEVENLDKNAHTYYSNQPIEIDTDRINNFLGIDVDKEYIYDLLKKLDFEMLDNKAVAPIYREDVKNIEDICEEVIRFYGFDKLKSTLPLVNAKKLENKLLDIKRNIKNVLVSFGFNQIMSYGFSNMEFLNKAGYVEKNNEIIHIINRLSSEYDLMKPTTIVSMLQIIKNNNSNYNFSLKLFDFNKKYYKNNNEYFEENILTIGITTTNIPKNITKSMEYINHPFFILKMVIEEILNLIGIKKYEILKLDDKNNNENMYNPYMSAKAVVGKDEILEFGNVYPSILKNFDIKEDVFVAEINLDKITKYARHNFKSKELSKYQASRRDISLIVPNNLTYSEIEKRIKKVANKILEDVQVIDIYHSDTLPKDKFSITLSLLFRKEDNTFKDEELKEIMKKIENDLLSLDAEIRE